VTDGIYRIVMKCMLIQEHQNRSNWSFDKNAKDFSGTGFSAFFWRRIPHRIYIERGLVY